MTINVEQYEQKAAHQSYIHRVLVAFDQLINVICGGDPDETISSRMLRWDEMTSDPVHIKRWIGRFMCWWLGLIQGSHDVKANIADYERAELEEQRAKNTLDVAGILLPKDKQ